MIYHEWSEAVTFGEWFDSKFSEVQPESLRLALRATMEEAWDAGQANYVPPAPSDGPLPLDVQLSDVGPRGDESPCCGAPAGQHKMSCGELRLS